MIIFFGVLFLVLGAAGLYWTGKRSFERRNHAGVEEFSSYAGAVGTKFFEAAIKVCSMFSLVFGLIFTVAFFVRG